MWNDRRSSAPQSRQGAGQQPPTPKAGDRPRGVGGNFPGALRPVTPANLPRVADPEASSSSANIRPPVPSPSSSRPNSQVSTPRASDDQRSQATNGDASTFFINNPPSYMSSLPPYRTSSLSSPSSGRRAAQNSPVPAPGTSDNPPSQATNRDASTFFINNPPSYMAPLLADSSSFSGSSSCPTINRHPSSDGEVSRRPSEGHGHEKKSMDDSARFNRLGSAKTELEQDIRNAVGARVGLNEFGPSKGLPISGSSQRASIFGDAKPREITLRDKGVDHRDIDKKYDSVYRSDTGAEQKLKDEVRVLKSIIQSCLGSLAEVDLGYLHNELSVTESNLLFLKSELDKQNIQGNKALDVITGEPSSPSLRTSTTIAQFKLSKETWKENKVFKLCHEIEVYYNKTPDYLESRTPAGFFWASRLDDPFYKNADESFLVRSYRIEGNSNMKPYFEYVRRLKDYTHVAKLLDFKREGEHDIILFERFDLTFSTFLMGYAAELIAPKEYKHADEWTSILICKFLDLARDLDGVHREGYFHGKMTVDSIYVRLNKKYKRTDKEFAKVFFSFPEIENLCSVGHPMEFSEEEIKQKQKEDWIEFGYLFLQTLGKLPPGSFYEIQSLAFRLIRGEISCLPELLEQPGLFIPIKRSLCFRRLFELLDFEDYDDVEFIRSKWVSEFEAFNNALPEDHKCSDSDSQYYFSKRLRNIGQHYEDSEMADVVEVGGGDYSLVMRRFRYHYPGMFIYMLGRAKTVCPVRQDEGLSVRHLEKLLSDLREF